MTDAQTGAVADGTTGVRAGAPRVSVIMTVRDGLPHVVEAVRSVLDQDLTDFELVVVDDGSGDGTVAELRRFDDPRMRLVTTPPLGRVAALNTALGAVRGYYVANLDADDVALPWRLSTSASFLDAHPEVGAVSSSVVPRVGRTRPSRVRLPLEDRRIRWAFLLRNPLVHTAAMFRADALRSVGGYDPRYERRCQDADLFLRIGRRHELANLPVPLTAKRVHEGQHFRRVGRWHRAHVHARLRRRAAVELGFPATSRPAAAALAAAAGLRSYVVIGVLGRNAG